MPVAGFEGPLASTAEKQGKRTSQPKLLLHLVSRTACPFSGPGGNAIEGNVMVERTIGPLHFSTTESASVSSTIVTETAEIRGRRWRALKTLKVSWRSALVMPTPPATIFTRARFSLSKLN